MREFRHSGSLLLTLLASINCVVNTLAFTFNEFADESSSIGQTLLHRTERDADVKHNVALKVNNLNDTHQQLIVHWVGEGSSIIICLARDSKEATRRPKMPSAVYYSYDYGETFENKTSMFKMPNETFFQLDKFYIHTKFPSRTIFTDSTNKMIFVTEDHGQTFRGHQLSFVPNDVSILQSSLKTFLVYDKTDPIKRLYITHDFGFTWTLLQEYVRSFEWFSDDSSDRKHLIVQREEHYGATVILKLKSPNTSFSKYDTEVLINSVIELSIKGDYIFATKNSTDNDSMSSQNKDLYIKYKSGLFMKTTFPSALRRKDFFVADITENRIMVVVHHNETLANLYVSEFVTDKTTEINFSLSLERIFCHFPNGTWRLSHISGVADATFADLHKVEGLRGIYIASIVLPSLGNTSAVAPEHLASRITFNWGVKWRPLNLTVKQGSDLSCQPVNECSLHLSQKFALLYPTTRQMTILTSKSAPGIIIGTGVYGKHMKGNPSVYMSRDAGVTFKQVLKENVYFNMGDHGGILVAIKFNQKQRENVSYIMYSTDMGENWQHTKLSDNPLRIYSLMTEPGENTTVFSLFGSPTVNEHHWVIVKADFQKVFNYNCTEDDFKEWTPFNPDEVKMNCVLGRKEVYKRRRPLSKCYIGLNFDHPVKADVCPCDKTDYMCDEGFSWDGYTGHCIRNKTLPDVHYAVPKICPPLTYFRRTKGYKKIPGDVCEGGPSKYQYDNIPCPLKEQREFLLLAQKDRIVRFKLEDPKPEVLPLPSLQNVIAVEYDMKNNCVFYADIVSDVISKWCVNSGSSPQVIVDNRLHSVEGMAFDWVSRHLYFVDGVRAKIEAVRVDVENSNRYRKTIINSTIARKPRGIAVHPMAGYVFWTDWISGNPSVSRACLDGSNPIALFTKPTVEWPNGITIDFIAERIYWVDAREDYIASSDYFGKGFKKIIEHDYKVSHPFSVAVFKDNMYWDDWRANAIYVADKDHGMGAEIVASSLPGLMDLKIYAHSVQEGVNGCVNSSCTHMCFGMPDNKITCACPDELTLVDEHRCVCPDGSDPKTGGCSSVQNTCGANYFRCNDGTCIPIALRCDGDDDCKDRSDELQCTNSSTTCEPNSFRCGNGRCILANWRCDHDVDCPDQSDEIGCQYPSCKEDHFACDNGRCISAKWRCDFENDCRDGSDERNCNSTVGSVCQSDEFKCPGGSGKNTLCIPMSWLCDNEPDCADGADEKNCTLNKCEDNKFQCANNKKCIYWMWRCDGEDDCGDGSDEENCTSTTDRPTSQATPFALPSFPCNHMTFQCLDKKSCVPLAWKCDHVRDCGDGSDEIGCGPDAVIEPKVKPSNVTLEETCKVDEYTCITGECVPQKWLCDRQDDCPDGDDEKFCDGFHGCRTDGSQFRCRKTGVCIDARFICDGVRNCADGSDEGVCHWSATIPPIYEVCPIGYFRCDESHCEPLHKRCDTLMDCVDETDEQNCSIQNLTYQAVQLAVDKIFEDGALITWVVKPTPPSPNSLEYLPSISWNHVWTNETTWTKYTFHRFDNLQAYTTYNVTIYVRDAKLNKIYPQAYYLTFTSGKGVPSPPRDVKARVISQTATTANIEVSWLPPVKPNGEIQEYIVYKEPPFPADKRTVNGKMRNVIIPVLFDDSIECKITVTAKNELFESAQSAVYTLTVGYRGLKKAVDLRADSPTENSVTLSWTAQKPNLNYTIYVLVATLRQMNSYPAIEPIVTNETSYTVSGLSPGVKYLFEITVEEGKSVSEPARVQASTLGTELPMVSNISVEAVKSKILVSWNPVTDEQKGIKYGYAVYYDVDMTNIIKGPKKKTNSTNVVLYDLAPCTSYLFDVGVVLESSSRVIYGPLSGNVTMHFTDIDVNAPPANVRITPDASAQPNITITWTASCIKVNRPVGYVIRILETNTKESYEISVNASTDFNFKYTFGAKFSCHYNISVATSTQRTKVKWIEFETNRIPPPTGVVATTWKKGHVMVYWLANFGDQSSKNVKYSYEILVCKGSHFNIDTAKIYNTSATSLLIKDLRDDQLHSFAVRIVMPDGRRSELSDVFVQNVFTEEAAEAPSSGSEKEEGMGGGLTWLFIVCITLISAAAGLLYWKRRRSHINSFKNLANSHYNTRSGSATFSGVNGLDLDDTPEIREHFSDDEPLVIA